MSAISMKIAPAVAKINVPRRGRGMTVRASSATASSVDVLKVGFNIYSIVRANFSKQQPIPADYDLANAYYMINYLQMAPMGDRLLVKPKELETIQLQAQSRIKTHAMQKTSGGLLLASTSNSLGNMQDAIVGTVMSVGNEVDIDVKVGDQVLFSKYGSSDVEAEEGKVSFVAQKSILAVLS